jgi:urate oxidase
MPSLVENSYGKSRVRLVKVVRHADRHEVKEITVRIMLEGDFESCYLEGDNSRILPTDTMKNTVYALARKNPVDELETFGQVLAQHFLRQNRQVSRVQIELKESFWERIVVDGSPHSSAFQRYGPEVRTAIVSADRNATVVSAGVEDLLILKTSDSGFAGYIRDEFTTLRETNDRLFGTALNAEWRYSHVDVPFNHAWMTVVQEIKKSFAEHKSASVQHTMYAIGEAVLERVKQVDEIFLSMPNKHCLLVDLTAVGLDNPNEIFVPTDEPHGSIEARIVR